MSADIHAQKILILDFGSQYTQLIARRVREVGVYSEIRAYDMPEEAIKAFNPNGIILSGGPESVTAGDSPRAPACVFDMGIPVISSALAIWAIATYTLTEERAHQVREQLERRRGKMGVAVEGT